MRELGLRSPASRVAGIVYFGRMLDKIRQHQKGQLPSDYQANLGRGFDSACTKFLRIDYNRLVDRVDQGGTDDEILQWRSEEHTSELQSHSDLVCRLLLEK